VHRLLADIPCCARTAPDYEKSFDSRRVELPWLKTLVEQPGTQHREEMDLDQHALSLVSLSQQGTNEAWGQRLERTVHRNE